jgi:hypothetical protein
MDYGLSFFDSHSPTPTPTPVQYFRSFKASIVDAELSFTWWIVRTIFIYLIIRELFVYTTQCGVWLAKKVAEAIKSWILYSVGTGLKFMRRVEDAADVAEDFITKAVSDASGGTIDLTADEFVTNEAKAAAEAAETKEEQKQDAEFLEQLEDHIEAAVEQSLDAIERTANGLYNCIPDLDGKKDV